MNNVSKKTYKLNPFRVLEKISRTKSTDTSLPSSIKKTIVFVKNLLTQIFTKKTVDATSLKINYKAESLATKNKSPVSIPQTFKTSLTKQEIDLFHMKTITLLKDHDIKFSTVTDQFKLIRQVPISIISEATSISKALAECVIATQTIHTLPGETIEIKGSFKRFSKGNCRSIPIPESFNLSAKSIQTGFPHPSQHHGWALPSAFVEKNVSLDQKMKNLAEELMPNGKFNKKAKLLLKLKTACFNQHAKELLKLHQQLDCLRCEKACITGYAVLDQFYSELTQEKYIYQILTDVHAKTSSKFSYYQELQARVLEKIQVDHPEILDKIALQQIDEFISELNFFDLDKDDMYQRLKDLLLSELLFWSRLP